MMELNFGTLNLNGSRGKLDRLAQRMKELRLGFCFLSETWIGPESAIPNNIVFHKGHERVRKTGHYPYGIGVIHNSDLISEEEFNLIKLTPFYLCFEIKGIRVIGCYIPPEREKEWMKEYLTEIEELTHEEKKTILIGDFNARHKEFGDHSSNQYGNILKEWIKKIDFNRSEPIKGKWTIIRNNGKERSIVDHMFKNFDENIEMKVHEEESLGGSDHKLVSGRIRIKVETRGKEEEKKGSLIKRWNRWRMNEPEIKEICKIYGNGKLIEWAKEIDQIIQVKEISTEEKVEKLEKKIRENMEEILKKFIGESKRRKKEWGRNFMTRDLIELEGVIEKSYQRWYKEKEEEKKGIWWQAYEKYKEEHRKKVKERGKEIFKEFCKKINKCNNSEAGKIIKGIKNARQRRRAIALGTKEENLKEYGEYFQEIYKREDRDEEVETVEEMGTEHLMGTDHLSLGKIINGIRELPNGKAAGLTGIPNETLKLAVYPFSIILEKIFKFIWKEGIIPQAWRESIIKPIPKKGDPKQIENYRPISLTESIRKLYEKLLIPKLKEYIEPLDMAQNGFRNRRGCIDAIGTLQEWMVQNRNKNRFMGFLDIKAAYDSVDRRILWEKLRKRKIPDDLMKNLKGLFEKNTARVILGEKESPKIHLHRGLLQGSIISPALYSLFINDLAEDLKGNKRKRSKDDEETLLYADDIAIMTTRKERMDEMLKICEVHSKKNNYRYNIKKCEIISNDGDNIKFHIYSEELKNCKNFIYLGVTINEKGINWTEHWKKLKTKSDKVMGMLRDFGCNSSGFNIKTCGRLYKIFIQPIMEYGLGLCHRKKDLKIPLKHYKEATGTIVGLRTGVNAEVLGIWAKINSPIMRQKKLALRLYKKIDSITSEEFALKRAYEKSEKKRRADSCFYQFKKNELILKYKSGKSEKEIWVEEEEKRINEITKKYKGGKIFSEKNIQEIDEFRNWISKLDKEFEREILLWTLNKSSGKWKTCKKCGKEGTKEHMEKCIKEKEKIEENIDERLKKAKSKDDLEKVGKRIQEISKWTEKKKPKLKEKE
jgi:hypothetical protein